LTFRLNKEIAVMKTMNSSTDIENGLSRSKQRNGQFIRVIQVLSWALTLLFLISLIGAIYQAVANRNPLPAWAWLGLVVLFAAATGLAVAAMVYRGASKQVGQFDYRSSGRAAGEIRSDVKHVEAGGAGSLRAEFEMLQGVLKMTGGAAAMDAAVMDAAVMDAAVMDAAFTYDDADWKPPAVEYTVDDGGQGSLQVEQKPTGRPAMRQGRCEWAIRLNADLPMDLNVKLGAGAAELRLGGLSLERLRVESGVGELSLDLSGEWKRSMQAFVKAGIGDTTLRLPQDAGVRLRSSVGLGITQPHGLVRDGDLYTNARYGQSPVTLDIIIEGGIGKIKLEQDG
jgi:hypothetical protein